MGRGLPKPNPGEAVCGESSYRPMEDEPHLKTGFAEKHWHKPFIRGIKDGVSVHRFRVEGKRNNSDPIRTWHKTFLAICVPSMVRSVVRSDERQHTASFNIRHTKGPHA